MKQFFKYVLVALLGMAMLSCSREDGADGINGINGKDGINGKTILSGRGRPYASLGVVGDFYIDLNTYNLYGPKTSQGWNNPISLIGADGKDGQDGKDGKDGADGRDGNDGRNGADGQDGRDGKDGQDAPRIWTGEIYPTSNIGNEGDFYLDLKNKMLYGPKTNGNWGTGIALGEGGRVIKADFLLSADGKILLDWLNTSITVIDMEADPDLRNVEVIGGKAFDGIIPTITEITLPNGLKHIEQGGFNGAYNLRTIVINNPIPPTVDLHALVINSYATIYVPKESVILYRSASEWRKYTIKPIQ